MDRSVRLNYRILITLERRWPHYHLARLRKPYSLKVSTPSMPPHQAVDRHLLLLSVSI
jgi:hypothetical protein